MNNLLQTINYIDYSLVCLVLVLVVWVTSLYYDLAAMTSRKEQWRFIALERERIAKRLRHGGIKVFSEAKEIREG